MVSTGHGTFCHGSRDFPPSFLQRVTVDSVRHSVASLQVTRFQLGKQCTYKGPCMYCAIFWCVVLGCFETGKIMEIILVECMVQICSATILC